MYVFPHFEGIFSAISFSLGNLSLLTNFQKLFTVSIPIVYNLHFYFKDVMLVLQ